MNLRSRHCFFLACLWVLLPDATWAAWQESGSIAKITRGPYLQTGTPHSVIIRWRTDVPTISRVQYGTNLAELDQAISAASPTTNHSVRVTNLEPSTRYYYAVGSDTEWLAQPHALQYYQTAPPPGTTDPIQLWVIGDAGSPINDAPPQIAVRNSFYNYNGTNHIDVWLQLGDNAYPSGTDAEYQHGQFNMYSNLLARTVTWPTLGNHDTANSTLFTTNYPYFEIYDLPTQGEAGGVPSGHENYYSFDYGNAHFISLDTQTSDLTANGPMANWLRADLAASTSLWTIVFFHHSPYSRGHRNSDTDPNMKAAREIFLPILEAAGVDLVLSGHSHVYERSWLINGHYGGSSTFHTNMVRMATSGRSTDNPGPYVKPHGPRVPRQGTVYAVVGCSGMSTAGGTLNHPTMFTAARVLGSLVMVINDARLDAWFLRETGAIDDTFTILKQEANHVMLFAQPSPQGGWLLDGVGTPGRLYTVEFTDSLQNPQWQSMGAIRADLDGKFSITDSAAATGSQRFYRAWQ
jgi:acid phosphatase type 7